jgi:uncharacterized protein (DUF885 family)
VSRHIPILVIVCNLSTTIALSAAESEDARLAAFFKTYLDQAFQLRPLEATRLGDHRFDDRLDDLSAAGRAAVTAHLRRTLADLPKQVQWAKLSRATQIDFEILQHHLTRELWLVENTDPFAQDPRVYNEYVSDSVYLLFAQSTQPRAVNLKNAMARIKRVPAVVAAARANLRQPPRVVTETALRQNKGAIAFYQRGLFELAAEPIGRGELGTAASAVVECLKDYQTFLEKELLPKATGDWRIGPEKFRKKLELELNAGLTADQVLAEAETEFRRVERDLYVIARQLWARAFAREPLPPDDELGRVETIRRVLAHFNKEHGQADTLTADARGHVDQIKRFITDRDILRLPDPDRCRIIEMPEFQRGNSVAYLNPAPPLDPAAESFYAVSPPPADWDARRVDSYLEEYNRRMLQILTIHEAYPGHYVQLVYANRHPSLIRKVLASGVFAEGWAVYTEQMMLDQGYGDGDPVLRLNQLKWYLRTIANAILDHRMHATNMTDTEALDLLTKRAFQTEGEALGKIVRAKQSSCQLSTYFVGRTVFYRLRQRVQRAQGDKFVLGRFHEAVLAHGTLPVKYLPELVAHDR